MLEAIIAIISCVNTIHFYPPTSVGVENGSTNGGWCADSYETGVVVQMRFLNKLRARIVPSAAVSTGLLTVS